MTQWRKCNRCGSIAPVYIPCPNCENASYTIGNPYFNTLPADIEKQLDIINGIPLDRLTQMCEAERDNRIVIIPQCTICKYKECLSNLMPCCNCIGINLTSYFEAAEAKGADNG